MDNTYWKSHEDYKRWADENERKLLEVDDPIIIEATMKLHTDLALSAYNKNKMDFFKEQDSKYQKFRQRACELKMDVSKFPETLEELTK